MSLTKIGSIGINTGIAFAGVTTIATLNGSDAVLSVGGTVNFVSDVSIGGTVSIAGTLTYEDVTNVDAVGLITARDGIKVGSGITLSKDGDVFFTGIATGNGSGLTNLTAGNLTGALPAISGANLTGIAATDNVRTGILDVAGIATFRSDTLVGSGITLSPDGDGFFTGVVTATSLSGTLPPANVSDQNNTSTGYFDLPVGTTAERPGSPADGMIRFNSSLTQTEEYRSSAWHALSINPL